MLSLIQRSKGEKSPLLIQETQHAQYEQSVCHTALAFRQSVYGIYI